MTGAGSATVAYALEQDYAGSLVDSDTDGNPEYYQPGKNITVGDASLENALQRVRDPDSAESVGSLAQNFEGALSVEFDLAGSNWHDLVFNDGGTGFTSGVMPSSTWFLGVDYMGGTSERALSGAVVTDAAVSYEQGAPIGISLTLIYGNEEKDVAITPSNIQRPTESDVYMFHGAELTVDAAVQAKLQSAELSIPTGARFHRGADRHPLAAVIGAVEPELTTTAIYEGPEQADLAYGGSTPASMLSSVNGSLALTNGTGSTITYNLTGMKPNSYNWASLVDAENDLTEPVTYYVDSVGVA